MALVKAVNPPETSAVCAPWRRIVADQRRAPGVNVMAFSITFSITLRCRPLSNATRSRNAGSKSISPRMARSVMAATWSLHPTEIGKFVDAFLADHGRIHVGDVSSFLRRPCSG